MDSHLSDDEFEELLHTRATQRYQQNVSTVHDSRARAHLLVCSLCKERLRQEEGAMGQILAVGAPGGAGPESGCPPEQLWIEIAAGIRTGDAEYLVSHAATCDHCGPLLRDATASFSPEMSAEEEAALAGLATSNPELQHTMSRRLLELTRGQQPVLRSISGAPWRPRKTVRWVVAMTAVTMVALVAFQLIWQRSRRAEPDQLVAAAYVEDRTIEVRIEGTGYAPLREARGDAAEQERMSRPALLTAEAQIAERLKTDPENVRWLQASGRVSLLEGDWKAAITALQKAQRLDERDLSVRIDLASAYILRGDTLGNISDYGQATDLLGAVLVAEPHNGVAEFNQAVAEEKQPDLKNDAIDEWKRFLEDHGDTGWASEARSHLEALEAETSSKEDRIRRSLWSAEQMAQSGMSQWRSRQDDEIDLRIEAYQDIAIQRWLPVSYDSARASSTTVQNTRAALYKLATLLAGRHHDKWMQDILTGQQGSRVAAKAVRLMSNGARLVQSSEDDQALNDALGASSLFEQAKIPAGYLYSQFTVAYVDQMLHRNAKCAAVALGVASAAASRGYRWLEIQSRLEFAICTSMDDERGLSSAYEALRMAEALEYPDLSLRARNVISALFWYAGNTRDAWLSNTEGMRSYWAGWSPPLRGYSFLDSLDEIAQEQHKWFLASAILRESIPMSRDNPDPAVRAFEQTRLGEALLNAGATEEADSSLQTAQKLFENVPSGSRRNVLEADIALGLAKFELGEGRPADALRRLDRIRAVIRPGIEDDLRLDYFGTYGIASMSAGRVEQARSSFRAALQLAERGLSLVSNEGDRLRWSRRNETLYRALVELELHDHPERAWTIWELYRGSAVRGRDADLQDRDLRRELHLVLGRTSSGRVPYSANVLLISYFLTPNRVNIWVSDGTFIKVQSSNVSDERLRSAIYRFVEECENPASDMSRLLRDGQELYEVLISPIEPWLGGHARLLVEPDGVVSMLPFSALVDHTGNYLSDRYSIAISPGIPYLSRARMPVRVTSQTPVLVIGNPSAPGWRTLPDSDREANQVAAKFNHSKLLLGAAATHINIHRDIAGMEIVHFSGHSTGDAGTANLIFAGSQRAGLAALRILSHPSVRLVVLASCDSAHGGAGCSTTPIP